MEMSLGGVPGEAAGRKEGKVVAERAAAEREGDM
jgi:hypothetical protein